MRAIVRRALVGAALGLLGGALAFMIALGRANLVASGGHAPGLIPPQHVSLAPSFLVAFALGGALLGLLAPMRRTPLGAFLLGVIAAAGFVVTVFAGLTGPPATWATSTWWVAGTATLVVGGVLGGQLQPAAGSG